MRSLSRYAQEAATTICPPNAGFLCEGAVRLSGTGFSRLSWTATGRLLRQRRCEKKMHFVKQITEKLTDLFDFFCSHVGSSSFQVRD